MRKDTVNIIGIFLGWKIITLISLAIAISFVPLGYTDRFLGGGPINYFFAPEVFSWANFDGEHYLSIAIFGYKSLEQAFFPVYPILISLISNPFYGDMFSRLFYSTMAGIFISNAAFLVSLIILFDLIRIDYSKKIAYLTILVLVFFPTSFYFGAVYNESLFLLLTLLSFYSARKKRFFLAGIFGGVASATRVFGILILPALIIEVFQQKEPLKNYFWIFLIPLGLLGYIYYQWMTVGDPIAFYNLQKIVGEQHQSGITILPQIFYRYINMIFSVNPSNPIFSTIILEFLTGILFFILPIYGYFKKVRLSYLFFTVSGFLLPTIQGSFSSLPRYILVLFPSFLVLGIFINKLPKFLQILLMLFLAIGLAVEFVLFARAYWVA